MTIGVGYYKEYTGKFYVVTSVVGDTVTYNEAGSATKLEMSVSTFLGYVEVEGKQVLRFSQIVGGTAP